MKDSIQNWGTTKARFGESIESMKLVFLLAAYIFILSSNANGQAIQIPTPVQQAFEEMQPETNAHWDIENDFTYEAVKSNRIPMSKVYYVAQFIENGLISAHVFNGHGKYIRKEVDIQSSELPALTQFLISSELRHPISKSSKWLNQDGSVVYFVRLGHQSYLFGEFGDNLGKYQL